MRELLETPKAMDTTTQSEMINVMVEKGHGYMDNQQPSLVEGIRTCNVGKHRNGGICPHQEGSTTIAQASRAK